jgi:DUF971 family protein
LYLTQFKKNSADGDENAKNNIYHLKFSDGMESDISTQILRDNCPCASCQGEQVLLHEYIPVNKPIVTETGYQIEKAEPVGNYAIKLTWKDGHDTGIYTWNHLRNLISQTKTQKEDES